MKDGFTKWSNIAPPAGVPLKIYCGAKQWVYSKTFTREEIEAWVCAEAEIELPNWDRIGWALTGIAKEMLWKGVKP